jgi:hypothetical protein
MTAILKCFVCKNEITTTDEYRQRVLKDHDGKTQTAAFHFTQCLDAFAEQNRKTGEYRIVGGEGESPKGQN